MAETLFSRNADPLMQFDYEKDFDFIARKSDSDDLELTARRGDIVSYYDCAAGERAWTLRETKNIQTDVVEFCHNGWWYIFYRDTFMLWPN